MINKWQLVLFSHRHEYLNNFLDIQVIYQSGDLVIYLLLNILVVPKVSTAMICSEYLCAYSLFVGLFPQSKTLRLG